MKKLGLSSIILAMVCMFFLAACNGGGGNKNDGSYVPPDRFDNGSSIKKCAFINFNEDTPGKLTSSQLKMYYFVTGLKGSSYNIKVNTDITIAILDENGNVIVSKNSEINWQCSNAGDYYLLLSSTVPQTYSLKISIFPSTSLSLTQIGLNEKWPGNLTSTELQKYFYFNAIQGDTYNIKITGDVTAAIINITGDSLKSGNTEFNWQCSTNGIYYVLISATTPQAYSVQVSVAVPPIPVVNDGSSIAQAIPMNVGNKIQGNFTATSLLLYYSFPTITGKTYDIKSSANSMAIFNVGGTNLNSGSNELTWQCQASGTYYVLVTSVAPQAFTLEVSVVIPLADSDGDGIFDQNDKCPNTPTNEKADANGCSASQRDSDNDGVTDDKDLCPNTPAGDKVDANGCTIIVPDGLTMQTAFTVAVNNELKGVSVGNTVYFSFAGKKNGLYDIDVVADTSVKTSLLDSIGNVIFSSTDGDSYLFNIHNWVCQENGLYFVKIEYLVPLQVYTVNIGEQMLASCLVDTDGDGIADCVDLVNNDGLTMQTAKNIINGMNSVPGKKAWYSFNATVGKFYAIETKITTGVDHDMSLLDGLGNYLSFSPKKNEWKEGSKIYNWVCLQSGTYYILIDSDDENQKYTISMKESIERELDIELIMISMAHPEQLWMYDVYECDNKYYWAKGIGDGEIQYRTMNNPIIDGYTHFDDDYVFFHVVMGETYNFKVTNVDGCDLVLYIHGREGGVPLLSFNLLDSNSINGEWVATRTDWILLDIKSWLVADCGKYVLQIKKISS